ncbi:MAG: FHA domain-containing protein [Eubacterium sp.]|nr:FHA domain-containing protein [Eubacterium sp.]
MNIQRILAALYVLIISIITPFSIVYSQSNANLTQANINDQNIDLFISGDFNSGSLSLKVANKTAEIKDCGLISEKEIPVRTTVLVDISASMPIESRDKVHELLENIIKNNGKKEEIKIIAFGAETNVLQDFTSNRYDLSIAASEIEFNGTQSALYDTIFNTLPEIKNNDGEPCFYRTAVITDGADFTLGGITKEELFMRLQTETYPIDVICVSANVPQNQDKDLAALTRISSGRYFELYQEADVSELVSVLSVNDYFWVRAEVSTELLDGSTRQVDISDGNSSISFDMKMSVVDDEEESEESALPAETDSVSDIDEKSEKTESPDFWSSLSKSFSENVVFFAAAAGAVILAVVIIIIMRVKKNKSKKDSSQFVFLPTNLEVDNIFGDDTSTELYTEKISDGHFAVKISRQGFPEENRIIDVLDDVLIGRGENCAFKVDDKSVSREQCKIAIRNGELKVINLSSSNVTKLNGAAVLGELLLHPGDNLKLGRVSLRIDYVQKVSAETNIKSDMDSIKISTKTGTEMAIPNDIPQNTGNGFTEGLFK